MKKAQLFGIALITAGGSLLAALLYEPANIVSILGLGNLLREGSVVLLSLVAIAACAWGGFAALRAGRRAMQLS